ncbi:hypothetical protein A2U01_0062303, partial [Trifolium medium]|nr:hypothetical protein [Trifolium medium]
VEVREKDLEIAQLNSEWTEGRFEEEASEETEEGEIASYTVEEMLVHEIDELDYQLYNMKECDVRTLKVCKGQIQEWVERLTIEINSRGPEAKDSQMEKERLW